MGTEASDVYSDYVWYIYIYISISIVVKVSCLKSGRTCVHTYGYILHKVMGTNMTRLFMVAMSNTLKYNVLATYASAALTSCNRRQHCAYSVLCVCE